MGAELHTDFNREVYALLGLPFDAVTLSGAADRLRAAMNARQPCLWITPNVNFVAAARQDPIFRASILKAQLSTVDGMPLVWLAKWMGIPLPERVSGSDVFEELCRRNVSGDASASTVFLYGGDDGVAQVAHDALNARASGMRSVGWLSPGRGSVDELSRPTDLAAIKACGADFLLVSLGAVKGHVWIDRNWAGLNSPVVSHLGAVINFLAGTVQRAPSWMQRFGLEWLWRIWQENTLWRRYYNDGITLFRILRESFFLYRKLDKNWSAQAASFPARLASSEEGPCVVWALSGVFTRHGLGELRQRCDALNQHGADLIVDLEGTKWLDSAAMGVLLMLHAHQLQAGRRLIWRGETVPKLFAAHGCGHLLLEPGQPAVPLPHG